MSPSQPVVRVVWQGGGVIVCAVMSGGWDWLPLGCGMSKDFDPF